MKAKVLEWCLILTFLLWLIEWSFKNLVRAQPYQCSNGNISKTCSADSVANRTWQWHTFFSDSFSSTCSSLLCFALVSVNWWAVLVMRSQTAVLPLKFSLKSVDFRLITFVHPHVLCTCQPAFSFICRWDRDAWY